MHHTGIDVQHAVQNIVPWHVLARKLRTVRKDVPRYVPVTIPFVAPRKVRHAAYATSLGVIVHAGSVNVQRKQAALYRGIATGYTPRYLCITCGAAKVRLQQDM